MEHKSADPAYETSEVGLFAHQGGTYSSLGDRDHVHNHISRDELTGGDTTNIDYEI
jgi:hypothetical protein